ncbi:thioredoxin family protein [Flavobacteriaceae bacterium]|nr:thioredoxin family protein [Flavobacteriaceae bacterium]MDA9977516.1 thioredoxin family protein [Flavobacteriaceae bacterium]MDB4024312.1 thioredoxin family protein [Flavobacteriaceae bacterium]MDB4131207.1 thioredoxin family protein [Flavobacteriaceae bacterium]MDC0106465.1 thioredoxin family protein [Flavobacteriaceae bacterium]
MSDTLSTMIPLGFEAPSFKLLDVKSNVVLNSNKLFGLKATVLMFICNHCPFVVHINKEIVKIANQYDKIGVEFIAICSNDIKNYPQDSPEKMKKVAKKEKYPFPYLYDENQIVAKSYDAACTPDFFIFDKSKKLVYRGQLDDSRPGNNIDVTGEDIRNAIDSIINSKEINSVQKPSIGCNIKWKN